MLLIGEVIVIVVVVERQDLGLHARFFEGGAEDFDEGQLILPRHIERHGVAVIERFVLHGDGVDREALLLHLLTPLDEVLRIIGIVFRVEAPAGPRIEGLRRIGDRALHPAGTRPR